MTLGLFCSSSGWRLASPSEWPHIFIQDVYPEGPYVGFHWHEALEDGHFRVRRVKENGPADKAGLRVDDVIVTFCGKKITNEAQFSEIIRERGVGATFTFVVKRRAKEMTNEGTIGNSGSSSSSKKKTEESSSSRCHEMCQCSFDNNYKPISSSVSDCAQTCSEFGPATPPIHPSCK